MSKSAYPTKARGYGPLYQRSGGALFHLKETHLDEEDKADRECPRSPFGNYEKNGAIGADRDRIPAGKNILRIV